MTKQSYTYFLDLATSPDRVQVISVSAGGMSCMRRLLPFFAAYKYYKLGPVNLKVVPASTLPVDPTGLSLEAGENTVDPRDQFNPGLVRITNGEDIIVPKDMDQYYTLMLDRRWYKFQLQSGFFRRAVPRVWRIAQLHQDRFPGNTQNFPSVRNPGREVYSRQGLITADSQPAVAYTPLDEGSDPRGFFQVGNNLRLDWLPTDSDNSWDPTPNVPKYGRPAAVPEVPLMTFVLPQAYKTKFFYRIYVTETVYFRDPVALNVNSVSSPGNFLMNNGVDRFSGIPFINYQNEGYRILHDPVYKGYINDGSDYRFDTGGA